MTGSWEVTSDLTPLSDYDEKVSRERISLQWLILKSHLHVNEVPKELQSPFYFDLDGNLSIKPILVNMLTSGELYCQASANLFYEWQLAFHDISSVICSLARYACVMYIVVIKILNKYRCSDICAASCIYFRLELF